MRPPPLHAGIAWQLRTRPNCQGYALRAAAKQMFVTTHQSVEATSLRMFAALKRRNHVTPTSYLEMVTNYRALLTEKRTELFSKANKLEGGLTKLDETRVQVQLVTDTALHYLCPPHEWLLAAPLHLVP